jgi:hypothetical protein
VFQESLKGDYDCPDAFHVDIHEFAKLDEQEVFLGEILVFVIGIGFEKPRKLHILHVVIGVLEHLVGCWLLVGSEVALLVACWLRSCFDF